MANTLKRKLIQIIPIKDSDFVCLICNVVGTSSKGKDCNFFTSHVIPKSGVHANINDNVVVCKNGNYDAYVVTE